MYANSISENVRHGVHREAIELARSGPPIFVAGIIDRSTICMSAKYIGFSRLRACGEPTNTELVPGCAAAAACSYVFVLANREILKRG